MPVRLVMFDLDGTLVDSTGSVADAMVEAFAPHGIVATREELVPIIGAPVATFVRDHYGLSEERAQQISTDYLELYHAKYIGRTQPHPGADALVRELCRRGYSLALVTNKADRGAREILGLMGWSDRFAVISSRESATAKPHPDAALSVLRALRLTPVEAVLVGDTEFDMNCGRDAGLAATVGLVGARDAERLRAEGATHVVEQLSEVTAILEAIG